jgi:alkylation response protein AidB-like acyl-CoA dehydrogenase
VETVDRSRQLAAFEAEAVPVDISEADLARFERRGALGTAAYLLGLARRQLDLTVGYVKARQQFGVAIGSFQAVKHPLADAVVGTEFAWPAVLRAAQTLVDDEPDADLHVSMAKALASDAAYRMSRVCLQAHGAMGYTVEYALHLFAKRTWALAKDWGTAAEHRELVAEQLGIGRDS